MRDFIVLFITAVLLAAQYYFGLRKSVVLGAILPGGLAGLLIAHGAMEGTMQNLPAGLGCVAALVIVWWIGCFHSQKHEKEELAKMKAKDIE